MINEKTKLKDDVTVDQAIPCDSNAEWREWREESNHEY
jgi:hypothetical protein